MLISKKNTGMKILSALFISLISLSAFSQSNDDGRGHKVVFQFVSGDSLSQKSLINNLKNFREGWPKAQAEVVFHGNGIYMIMNEKSAFAKELQDFSKNKDVKMVVCGNTMKQKQVNKNQLMPFVSIVPMGIGEIVIKQEQGWSYIKAGL